MLDKIQTGKRIALMRKRLGMSQSALAEKMNVSTQAVSKWETGQAVPDVELLMELSWLFGVSINSLLEGGENFVNTVSLLPTELPARADRLLKNKNDKKLLLSAVPYFTETELSEIARLRAEKELDIKLSISASVGEKSQSIDVDMSQLSDSTLRELSMFTSDVLNVAVSDIPRELRRVHEIMRCPKCGEKLELVREGKKLFFICPNEHKAEIIDGVAYFGTRELRGELWSQWYRNYDHYCESHLEFLKTGGNPNFRRGDRNKNEVLFEQIKARKPKIILDIASGMCGGICSIIDKIDWHCMIIATDLSHRILSWDKQFLETYKANPYVEMVFLACDCTTLPIADNSIDLVTSYAGFESMQDKLSDGMREANRVLKPGHAAVYTRGTVEDKSSDNTKKWIELLDTIELFHNKEDFLVELGEWAEICKNLGYSKTFGDKIYGELPAPDTDVFPFNSEIMQWMCEYVCVSEK